jgi:hypothetical protein
MCDWLESQAWMIDAWIGDALERSNDTEFVVALCQHREWLRAQIDAFRSRRLQRAAHNDD